MSEVAVSEPLPVSIEFTEVRYPPRSSNGHAYRLHVRLPRTYAKLPDQRYPVVYLLDGQWDFSYVAGAYGLLVFDELAPECLIVGICYPGIEPEDFRPFRTRDFITGSDEFIGVLERDLIPYVDREFRTDPYRVISGGSLGGDFALQVLFTRPELFHAYVAAPFGNPSSLALEQQFAAKVRDLARPLRLHVSWGDHDSLPLQQLAQQLLEQLELHRHPALDFEVSPVEHAGHATVKALGFTRGLAYALAPVHTTAALPPVEHAAPIEPTRNYVFTTEGVGGMEAALRRVLEPFTGMPEVRLLEIGVFEGRSLLWMMEQIFTHPTARAVAIECSPEHSATLIDNVTASGLADRIELVERGSRVELVDLSATSFDVILVDGSRAAGDVLFDVVIAWELLEIGGVLIVHHRGDGATRETLDGFVQANRRELDTLHADDALVLRKRPPVIE